MGQGIDEEVYPFCAQYERAFIGDRRRACNKPLSLRSMCLTVAILLKWQVKAIDVAFDAHFEMELPPAQAAKLTILDFHAQYLSEPADAMMNINYAPGADDLLRPHNVECEIENYREMTVRVIRWYRIRQNDYRLRFDARYRPGTEAFQDVAA